VISFIVDLFNNPKSTFDLKVIGCDPGEVSEEFIRLFHKRSIGICAGSFDRYDNCLGYQGVRWSTKSSNSRPGFRAVAIITLIGFLASNYFEINSLPS
jgi:hypothetical protein